MLYLTTDKNKVGIFDVEAYFSVFEKKYIFGSEIYKNVIKEIDNADFIEGNIVKTEFGVTTFDNLSTGCKTLLLMLYFSDNFNLNDVPFISLVECGDDVLTCIYKFSKTKNLKGYLNYGIHFKDKDAKCIIDGKEFCGNNEIYFELIR